MLLAVVFNSWYFQMVAGLHLVVSSVLRITLEGVLLGCQGVICCQAGRSTMGGSFVVLLMQVVLQFMSNT